MKAPLLLILARPTLRPFLVLVLGAALLPGLAAAQTLESFVLSAGGSATCGTFVAPAPVFARFGPVGVSEPVPGFAACNVPASQRFSSATSGTLSDSTVLQTSWSTGAIDGDTQVRARFGYLWAAARSVYLGQYTSFTVSGTEGFSTCQDLLTLTSPSVPAGTLGSLRILVEVSGDLSTTTGISDVELSYRLGNAIAYTLFRGQVSHPAGIPFLIAPTSSAPLTGFVLTPGTASGSSVVETFQTPFVFGTALDFELRLLAYTITTLTGTTVSDFHARVVGFQVFAGAQPVTDFRVRAASGTTYGPSPRKWAVAPAPLALLPVTVWLPYVMRHHAAWSGQ